MFHAQPDTINLLTRRGFFAGAADDFGHDRVEGEEVGGPEVVSVRDLRTGSRVLGAGNLHQEVVVDDLGDPDRNQADS